MGNHHIGRDIEQLTSSDIGDLLKGIGKAYHSYYNLVIDHGITGKVLNLFAFREESFHQLLEDVGITNKSHQNILWFYFLNAFFGDNHIGVNQINNISGNNTPSSIVERGSHEENTPNNSKKRKRVQFKEPDVELINRSKKDIEYGEDSGDDDDYFDDEVDLHNVKKQRSTRNKQLNLNTSTSIDSSSSSNSTPKSNSSKVDTTTSITNDPCVNHGQITNNDNTKPTTNTTKPSTNISSNITTNNTKISKTDTLKTIFMTHYDVLLSSTSTYQQQLHAARQITMMVNTEENVNCLSRAKIIIYLITLLENSQHHSILQEICQCIVGVYFSHTYKDCIECCDNKNLFMIINDKLTTIQHTIQSMKNILRLIHHIVTMNNELKVKLIEYPLIMNTWKEILVFMEHDSSNSKSDKQLSFLPSVTDNNENGKSSVSWSEEINDLCLHVVAIICTISSIPTVKTVLAKEGFIPLLVNLLPSDEPQGQVQKPSQGRGKGQGKSKGQNNGQSNGQSNNGNKNGQTHGMEVSLECQIEVAACLARLLFKSSPEVKQVVPPTNCFYRLMKLYHYCRDNKSTITTDHNDDGDDEHVDVKRYIAIVGYALRIISQGCVGKDEVKATCKLDLSKYKCPWATTTA